MKKKPTIAELEAILDGRGGGSIYIAPNGELKNHPVKGSKKDAQRLRTTSPIKAAVEDAKVQLNMAAACLNSKNIEKARRFLDLGIDRLNWLLKCNEQKQPTA